jgi:hypothetical protein
VKKEVFADKQALRATDTIRELKKELAARQALLVSILGVLKPSPKQERYDYIGCETCGWHGCGSDLEGCEIDHNGECGEPVCPSCMAYIESSDEPDLFLKALCERVERMVEGRPWPVRECHCGVEIVEVSQMMPQMCMCSPCWEEFEIHAREESKQWEAEMRKKGLIVD